MTLSYELCKRLKDAGFPQIQAGIWVKDYTGDINVLEREPYEPTLSELIEACGDKFMNLRKVWDENGRICNWIVEGDTDPVETVIGQSPEEAVANLIIKIHEPKTSST